MSLPSLERTSRRTCTCFCGGAHAGRRLDPGMEDQLQRKLPMLREADPDTRELVPPLMRSLLRQSTRLLRENSALKEKLIILMEEEVGTADMRTPADGGAGGDKERTQQQTEKQAIRSPECRSSGMPPNVTRPGRWPERQRRLRVGQERRCVINQRSILLILGCRLCLLRLDGPLHLHHLPALRPTTVPKWSPHLLLLIPHLLLHLSNLSVQPLPAASVNPRLQFEVPTCLSE